MNKSIPPITFIDKLVKKNARPGLQADGSSAGYPALAFTFEDQAAMDTVIYSCVKKSGRYCLRQHVLNAVSVETPAGIRLSQTEKPVSKIDGCAALSFAVQLRCNMAGRRA